MTEPVVENIVANTWTKALVPPEDIPATADVVVIGGGIVGVSTAWFLAKQGIDVVLCEKGHIAGEQSGRNWGWVRAQGRDSREMPMMLESLRIWDGLAEEIGEDVGFTRGGCFFTAGSTRQMQSFEETRQRAWSKLGRSLCPRLGLQYQRRLAKKAREGWGYPEKCVDLFH